MWKSCNNMLSLRWSSKVIIVALVIDKKHSMYVIVRIVRIYVSNLFLAIKHLRIILCVHIKLMRYYFKCYIQYYVVLHIVGRCFATSSVVKTETCCIVYKYISQLNDNVPLTNLITV